MKPPFLILFFFFLGVGFVYSQCPTGDFVAPESVCIEENFDLKNILDSGEKHFWDFCTGDFDVNPGASVFLNSNSVSSPFEIETVKNNGNFYGFVSSRGLKKLIRLDFGSSLLNTPQIVDLGDLGLNSNQLLTVRIVKEGLIWYGFIIDFNASKLYRLTFGEDLLSIPLVNDLGDFAAIKNPTGLEIVKHNGNIFAFISNYSNDKVAVISFGSSFLNTPSNHSIRLTGASQVGGIRVIQDNCSWYGLATSRGNGKVFKINFGSELSNLTPTVSEVVLGITVPSPSGIVLAYDGGNYYSFIQSNTTSGQLTRLNFGSSLTNSPTAINLGNLNVLEANWGLSFFKDESKWIGFSSNNSGNKITRLDFSNTCSSSIKSSTLGKIESVHFTKEGTHNISLTVTDNLGNLKRVNKGLNVISSNAPKISFSQIEYCQTSTIQMLASNLTTEQTITSWSWNLGDGSTASVQNPQHQYASPGTYKVRLNVESENGCGNYFEKEVTVYPEPQAAYELSAALSCTNTGINFTNLTDFPVDSVITYSWNFGDGNTSADKSPEHTFAEAGTYAVILEASIPGCSTSSTQYVEVKAGPKTLFAASPVCDEQKVVFLNQTTGEDIRGYEWDLGDGTSATVENPEHIYDAPGSYLVILKSSNTLGCVSSHTQTLRVYSNPVPDFTSLPACAGSEVVFTDATIDADGNIEAWKWSFEMPDGTITERTEQNPAVTYPKAGTYGVTLAATTTWGCERTIRKTVVVQAVPEVAIGLEGGCLGAPSLLADWSETNGVKVQSWFWMVDNQIFTDSAFAYTFPSEGSYEVLLQLNLENGCSVRDTREVIIGPLPEVDFTYSGSCPGQMASFNTTAQATEYVWTVDGKVIIGEGSDLQYTFKELGSHTVSLRVQDEKGCSNTLSKEIEVVQPPVAAFTADRNKGVPPFEVQFTNGSKDGATYQWFFGAGQGSSEEEHPVYTFSEIGEYEVSLVTYNAAGCSDTATQRISVVEPKFDVVLHSVNMLQQNDQMQLVLSIENGGTILVRDMDIEVLINNEFVLTEKFEGILEIGQKVNYPLRMQVNDSGKRKVRFICVELKPVLSLVSQELSVENNKKCPSLDQAFVMQDPFPNPSRDIVSLEFILPQPGTVSLTLYSVHGILVREAVLKDLKAHLNKVELDVHGLGKGIYFLRARFGTEEVNYRIMKD